MKLTQNSYPQLPMSIFEYWDVAEGWSECYGPGRLLFFGGKALPHILHQQRIGWLQDRISFLTHQKHHARQRTIRRWNFKTSRTRR